MRKKEKLYKNRMKMANEQKKIGWLTNSKAMDKNVTLMNDRTSRWLMNEYRKKLQKLIFFLVFFLFFIFLYTQFFFDVYYARTR
jgi:hypothetical protein